MLRGGIHQHLLGALLQTLLDVARADVSVGKLEILEDGGADLGQGAEVEEQGHGRVEEEGRQRREGLACAGSAPSQSERGAATLVDERARVHGGARLLGPARKDAHELASGALDEDGLHISGAGATRNAPSWRA